MEFQSIFAWESLPEAGFGKNVVIDAHRCRRFPGTSQVILAPSGYLFKGGRLRYSDRCVCTRGSVRRASGFVLTGYPETIHLDESSFRFIENLLVHQTP